MRRLTHIVTHHSITPRDLPLALSLRSFDRTHKARLHKYKNALGHYIAYHYVIAGNGDYKQTRPFGSVGYHAGNWSMNKESIGICLTGNFDKEKPSPAQLKTLIEIIGGLRDSFGNLKVIGHKDVKGVTKSCPGKNFPELKTLNMNDNLLEDTIYLLKELWPLQNVKNKKAIGTLANKIRGAQKALGLEVTR